MKDNELMTSLRGNKTDKKNSAQINLRGEIDSLYAQAIFTCSYARQYGYMDILSGLEDMIRVIRDIMHADALNEEPRTDHILGLAFDELRTASNNPRSELGIEHALPDETSDDMTALINILRTQIRRCERAAVTACELSDTLSNKKIQLILNRLSSAAYILMLEHMADRDF